jgi:hypothetical protein
MSDEEFVQSRPATFKTRETYQWPVWREQVMCVIRGFALKSDEERQKAELEMTELPRRRLARTQKSGAEKRERDEDEDSIAKRMVERQVRALINMGAIGRACRRMMDSFHVLSVTDDVVKQLRALHPESERPDIPEAFWSHRLTFTTDEVKNVVKKKLAKGAAPGMDGWTRELLLPLVENAESCRDLTAMFNSIINRNGGRIWTRLMACPVIPLDKQPGVRPIAVESTLVKVMAHLCLAQIGASAWQKSIPDHQYGAGPHANVEVAALRIRRLMDQGGNFALALDCRNAYNTISREAIVKAVKANQELWPIYRIAALSLSPSVLCVMNQGKTAAEIMSLSGVRQGSVLGPILFALGLQGTLNKTAQTSDNIKVVAYLDDITLLARDMPTLTAVARPLVQNLKEIGLVVNMQKSRLLSRLDQLRYAKLEFQDGLQTFTLNGMSTPQMVLGAMMYFDAELRGEEVFNKVKAMVTERAMTQQLFFDRLREARLDEASAFSLLRKCGTSRINFLLRTHPEWAVAEAAEWFDDEVLKAVVRIAGHDVVQDPTALLMLELPVAHGGLGLRRMSQIAKFAHDVASKAEQGVAGPDQKHKTEERDKEVLMGVKTALAGLPNGEKLRMAGAQSKVMAVSVYSPTCGFRQYVRERIGLPLAPPNVRCKCGELATNAHLRTCGKLNHLRIRRHDKIKMALAREARKRFPVHVEPHGTDLESRTRPDLTIYRDGEEIHVDVAVTYSGRAECDNPLRKEALAKMKKYEHLNLIPFIVGTSGNFEEHCQSLFNVICTSIGERQALQQTIFEILMRENMTLVLDLTKSTLNNYVPPVEEEAGVTDEPDDVSLYSCNEEAEEVEDDEYIA